MNKYKITVLRNGDKMLPFIITVCGMSQEDAINRAKKYIAENAHWPMNMDMTDRIKCLSAKHIEIQSTNISTT